MSEDFGQAGVPILLYRIGTVEKKRLDRYASIPIPPPSLHSSTSYPGVDLTLKNGVRSTFAAALDLMRKPAS